MDTRMSKYNSEEINTASRVKKNAKLYDEINNSELNNFTLRSNATIIGKQENEIDVEKIKKILDTRYKDVPQRRSIRIEQEEEHEPEEVPTKEYDLNSFIEKAKDEKSESYGEVRAKRLRDTQFDILKNLNIPETEEDEEVKTPKPEDNDLLNLINTITMNEAKEKENSKEEMNSKSEKKIIPETKEENAQLTDSNSIEEIKNEIKKVEKTSSVMTKTSPLDNSFYTSNNLFKKKDFSDDEEDNLSLWIKILIVLIIVGVLVGLFFFLKSIITI